jgi:hypothetical protein
MHLHEQTIVSGIPGRAPMREIFDAYNDRPIDFLVDFEHHTFQLIRSPFTFFDGDATLTVVGR